MKTLLKKHLDPVGQVDLAGVYEITYITENGDFDFYKWMTGRKFVVRKGKHGSDFEFDRTKTALY